MPNSIKGITMSFSKISFIVLLMAVGLFGDANGFAYPSASPSSNSTNSTIAPTLSPSTNNTNSTTAPTLSTVPSQSPSISHSPSVSSLPTSAPVNATTKPSASPSISNAPTITGATGGPTTKPTKKYVTPAPTSSANPKPKPAKKHGFFYKVFRFIFWCLIIAASVLAFGACLSNRSRIYFILCQVWYRVKEAMLSFMEFMREGCEALSELQILNKLRNFAGRVGAWFRSLADRIRGGRGVDDDGSTMMEGLLLREGV